MKTSETIGEIAKAISIMQGTMDPAKKDKINPYFKSQYADLPSVWQAIREPLSQNGLCVVQDAITLDTGISVITRVIHTSGEWIEFGPLLVPLAKNDAQAVGSAISYGKRYAIGAALGVVAEVDDDGNKASKAAPAVAPKKKVIPYTEEQIDEWIDLWSRKYDIQDLQDYCEERAKHFNHKIGVTVAELQENEALFVKNMEVWLKKKVKED